MKSDSANAAGWNRGFTYMFMLVIPGRQIRASHWSVGTRRPLRSSSARRSGLNAEAVSASIFCTRLVTSESPVTANWKARFAGISAETRGFSPAHSQRMTFEV